MIEQAEAVSVFRSAELAANARHHLPAATIDILPAHINLVVAEQELVSVFQRENRLKRALQTVQEPYDFVIIDCPPSFGLLTVNALIVVTEILIPVEPGVFPLIGLGLLHKTIDTIKRLMLICM